MQSTEQLKIKLEDKSISKEERIGILINLSSNLLQIDLEEALKYNKQADELSIDYPENHIDRGLILNNYGVYYYMINLNEQALAKFIEADKILSQSEQLEHRILSKADIGLIYTRTRQYEEALDIYLQIEKNCNFCRSVFAMRKCISTSMQHMYILKIMKMHYAIH